jgi:NAD-dependent DNA ligase|tara:strand:+ start:393 stop:680 length:288 start_codon:yes stop_codon:yes gene_type:complete
MEDKIWNKNPNMLIPYYLMFSYLYYEKDTPLITDGEFDDICKTLLEKFDDLKHMHKHLVTKESLTAGTGYDIKYTNMIKDSAIKLKESWKNARIN